ncbi:aldehyde dehydrogenase family protein, partial [Lacticaseibacillus rhamnosus]
GVDMVSFTGSTDIGAKVAAQAAPSMKRLQLELGGKSAQIFLPDRVEAAFSAAISVCLAHAGQGCVLGTRVFVPEAEKPKVLAAMKASLAHAKIGDSNDPATTMGPVISEAQAERCAHEFVSWVRLLSVHAPHQVLFEGLAQALPLVVVPGDEALVARVSLTHYVELVRSELHLAVNSGADIGQCVLHARARVPLS